MSDRTDESRPRMIGRPVFDPEPGSNDPGKWKRFFEGMRAAAEAEQPPEAAEAKPEVEGGPEAGDEALPYAPIDSIDFGQTLNVLRGLVFFDDVFLHMQAMNVAIVDPLITEAELNLLGEWIESERTPGPSAMQVSALSQMWIFALYELLRTWRERIKYLQTQHKNGMLADYVKRIKAKADANRGNLSSLFRAIHAEQVLEDPGILAHADAQRAAIDRVWKAVEAMRMNLAKHGAPGGGLNNMPMAPGYGRINMWCGAMDFEIAVDKNETYVVMNRRDIADALRETTVPAYSGASKPRASGT
jgi:hypothetical protein